MKSRFVRGTHNAICDQCGFKFKRSEMRKTWDGLLVCRTDYDEKHPQLTIRPHPERVTVSDPRLESRGADTNLAGTVRYAIAVDSGGTEHKIRIDTPVVDSNGDEHLVSKFAYNSDDVRFLLYQSQIERDMI